MGDFQMDRIPLDHGLIRVMYENGMSIRDMCKGTGWYHGEVNSAIIEIENQKEKEARKAAKKERDYIKRRGRILSDNPKTRKKREQAEKKRLELDGIRQHLPQVTCPSCFTEKQWDNWTQGDYRSPQCCRDCTPEYQGKMISKHLCACPTAVFVWRKKPDNIYELVGIHPTEVWPSDDWAVRGDPQNQIGYRV